MSTINNVNYLLLLCTMHIFKVNSILFNFNFNSYLFDFHKASINIRKALSFLQYILHFVRPNSCVTYRAEAIVYRTIRITNNVNKTYDHVSASPYELQLV